MEREAWSRFMVLCHRDMAIYDSWLRLTCHTIGRNEQVVWWHVERRWPWDKLRMNTVLELGKALCHSIHNYLWLAFSTFMWSRWFASSSLLLAWHPLGSFWLFVIIGSKEEDIPHFWSGYHWITSWEKKIPINTGRCFVNVNYKWYKFMAYWLGCYLNAHTYIPHFFGVSRIIKVWGSELRSIVVRAQILVLELYHTVKV